MHNPIRPADGLAHLEASLGLAVDSTRENLDHAKLMAGANEWIARDKAYERAVGFMKATAKVGLALARLKSEHAVHVHRTTETLTTPVVRPPRPALARKPMDPATAARVDKIYYDWLAAKEANEAKEAQDAQEAAASAEGGDAPITDDTPDEDLVAG